MSKVSLVGLNKADVLAALYNAARPQGLGFLHYDSKPMERKQAEKLLEQTIYFDYLKGRAVKLDMSGEKLDTTSYNQNNGPGLAEQIIKELRENNDINSLIIQTVHHINTLAAAKEVKALIYEEGYIQKDRGFTVINLVFSGHAERLDLAVDEAVRKCKE